VLAGRLRLADTHVALPTIISLSISASAAISVIMHNGIGLLSSVPSLPDRREMDPVLRQQPLRVYGAVD
jgi:hypothetical protein